MKKCQEVRINMIKNQKIKTPFHIQFFKHAKKQTVLSYLAVRSVGLYKYKGAPVEFNPKKIKINNLKELIETNVFVNLNDFLPPKQYITHFWNRRSYNTFGGVSYGSIIRDNITHECHIHGQISGRKEVWIEFVDIIPDKPPDSNRGQNMLNESPIVEIVNHRTTPNWREYGLEYLNQLKKCKEV